MSTVLDTYNEVKVVQAVQAQRGTTTITGLDVDTQTLTGRAFFIVDSNFISGTPTLDWKLQDAPESTSTPNTAGTYADVAGATLAQVTTTDKLYALQVNLDGSLRRFLRLVGTIGGGSPVIDVAAYLIAGSIKMPVGNPLASG